MEIKGERIAKFLSRAGVCSRRDAERMILEGRVSVNGIALTSPALNVLETDKIEVDGAVIGGKESTRLWRYHKPRGLITSHKDEKERETIFDSLPENLPRVMSVGRLDMNSEGLLLLTNNGELSRFLELPATGWTRKYRVRAFGDMTDEKIQALYDGVTVEGISYGSIEVKVEREKGDNVWMEMILREGKNREIRRVLSYLGLEVNRLIRISYGPFHLSTLAEGCVEELSAKVMRDAVGDRFL